MSADSPSSDAGLVEALSGRLERLELYVARELVDWVEGATLSFAEMRVFLAMADAGREAARIWRRRPGSRSTRSIRRCTVSPCVAGFPRPTAATA